MTKQIQQDKLSTCCAAPITYCDICANCLEHADVMDISADDYRNEDPRYYQIMEHSKDQFGNNVVKPVRMEFVSTEIDLDREIPEPEVDEDDFWNTYCDEHPDFNAAMNGHPDYVDYTGFESYLEKHLIA